LALTPEEREQLQELRDSQTAPWREVQRARILWRYHCGENIAAIARAVKMTRTSVGRYRERKGIDDHLVIAGAETVPEV
jgi:hypothetical protein